MRTNTSCESSDLPNALEFTTMLRRKQLDAFTAHVDATKEADPLDGLSDNDSYKFAVLTAWEKFCSEIEPQATE